MWVIPFTQKKVTSPANLEFINLSGKRPSYPDRQPQSTTSHPDSSLLATKHSACLCSAEWSGARPGIAEAKASLGHPWQSADLARPVQRKVKGHGRRMLRRKCLNCW
jgi:hypothetical protein